MCDISGGLEPCEIKAPYGAAHFGFTYIKTSLITRICDKNPALGEQYSGCSCSADGSCSDEASCECLRRCGGATYNGITRRLRAAHLPSDEPSHSSPAPQKPVLECNMACACRGRSPPCANRVVQLGPTRPLEVHAVSGKGYGVRCQAAIPRGSFVCEYAGEVLSAEEAQLRAGLSARGSNYLLVLRERVSCGQLLTTYIDAERFGNVARFINHSCEPNLDVVAVRVDNAITRVALFARQDIAALEELTFAYGDCEESAAGGARAGNESSDRESNTANRHLKPCCCGSGRCQGWLPYDPDLFH